MKQCSKYIPKSTTKNVHLGIDKLWQFHFKTMNVEFHSPCWELANTDIQAPFPQSQMTDDIHWVSLTRLLYSLTQHFKEEIEAIQWGLIYFSLNSRPTCTCFCLLFLPSCLVRSVCLFQKLVPSQEHCPYLLGHSLGPHTADVLPIPALSSPPGQWVISPTFKHA